MLFKNLNKVLLLKFKFKLISIIIKHYLIIIYTLLNIIKKALKL